MWLHSFLTSPLDGGEQSASRPGGRVWGWEPAVPIDWAAGWVPEPVWTP